MPFFLFTAHLAGPAGHLAFSFSRIGSTFLHPVLGLVKLLELAYAQAGMAEISPYVVKEPWLYPQWAFPPHWWWQLCASIEWMNRFYHFSASHLKHFLVPSYWICHAFLLCIQPMWDSNEFATCDWRVASESSRALSTHWNQRTFSSEWNLDHHVFVMTAICVDLANCALMLSCHHLLISTC